MNAKPNDIIPSLDKPWVNFIYYDIMLSKVELQIRDEESFAHKEYIATYFDVVSFSSLSETDPNVWTIAESRLSLGKSVETQELCSYSELSLNDETTWIGSSDDKHTYLTNTSIRRLDKKTRKYQSADRFSQPSLVSIQTWSTYSEFIYFGPSYFRDISEKELIEICAFQKRRLL
ncbi:MAG: hypothetical protein OHK0012_14340 [Synechococcales cyanobacterium]